MAFAGGSRTCGGSSPLTGRFGSRLDGSNGRATVDEEAGMSVDTPAASEEAVPDEDMSISGDNVQAAW
ncbi:MAG TPA: hypothetical protein VGI44_06215, partial [Acidimicrobiales bacterium]